MSLSKINDGHLVFSYTQDGVKYEVEAEVESLEINTDVKYDYINTDRMLDSARVFLDDHETTFVAKVKDQYTIKWNSNPEVERTARIRIEDTTGPNVEAARRAVGAPENAQFVIDHYDPPVGGWGSVGGPRPAYVIFRWTDNG